MQNVWCRSRFRATSPAIECTVRTLELPRRFRWNRDDQAIGWKARLAHVRGNGPARAAQVLTWYAKRPAPGSQRTNSNFHREQTSAIYWALCRPGRVLRGSIRARSPKNGNESSHDTDPNSGKILTPKESITSIAPRYRRVASVSAGPPTRVPGVDICLSACEADRPPCLCSGSGWDGLFAAPESSASRWRRFEVPMARRGTTSRSKAVNSFPRESPGFQDGSLNASAWTILRPSPSSTWARTSSPWYRGLAAAFDHRDWKPILRSASRVSVSWNGWTFLSHRSRRCGPGATSRASQNSSAWSLTYGCRRFGRRQI